MDLNEFKRKPGNERDLEDRTTQDTRLPRLDARKTPTESQEPTYFEIPLLTRRIIKGISYALIVGGVTYLAFNPSVIVNSYEFIYEHFLQPQSKN